MLRLLISAIIGLIIASVAVPQDTHLPLVIGEATGNTSTPTMTVTGTILATSTGTVTSTPTTTPTFTPTGTSTATGTSTSTPTITQTPTSTATGTTTSTPTTTPTVTLTATATEVVNATCDCSGNVYNCPNFATQPQAQACFNYCVSQGKGDIHGLDMDDDGIACEGLPPTWIVR